MASKKITIHGLADCHGIESIFEEMNFDNDTAFCLNIRAMANAQRHAVVYKAVVREAVYQKIQALMKNKNYIGALNYLKNHATSVFLPKSTTAKTCWTNIPNPKLDPYS